MSQGLSEEVEGVVERVQTQTVEVDALQGEQLLRAGEQSKCRDSRSATRGAVMETTCAFYLSSVRASDMRSWFPDSSRSRGSVR